MHVGLAPVVKNVFLHVFDSCLDPAAVDWYNAEFGLEQGDDGDVVDQVLAQRCFIRDEIFSDGFFMILPLMILPLMILPFIILPLIILPLIILPFIILPL